MKRHTEICLGYEIGTGHPVNIPLRHMAVTGQTQESGKTTTLEALVSRLPENYTAVAFITKRGERSFTSGRRVSPYFRDRADWQFVTSIIDATLQEKNKFLRPWIMRICRTTKTLADVHRAVRKELETARGMNEGVYTQLDAYLELIVPEIAQAELAPKLSLYTGMNVMDLSGYSTPMQMLFVQSALDEINAQWENVVVIVPEAWEFIPEGKGSPVKASAVALVRKGAGIGNFIWVDSQDMAGVDKTILRGCPVWLMGVQREANEIKRNLSNIPAGIKKPKAADISSLGLGQFYACWGDRTVKTYVRPEWLDDAAAADVARGGRIPAAHPAAAPAAAKPATKPTPQPSGDSDVDQATADRLMQENAELRRQVQDLTGKLAFLGGAAIPVGPVDMVSPAPIDEESLYQRFKARLLQEAPAIAGVNVAVPELIVTKTRRTLQFDETSLKGRVARLIGEGFFGELRTQSATRSELKRTGPDCNSGNLSRALDDLRNAGFLVEESGSFRTAPGLKVSTKEIAT